MAKKTILFLLCVIILASCTVETGIIDNPTVAIQYKEKPADEYLNQLLKEYRKAVNAQKKGELPFPGLYADYAVLLERAGKKQEAAKYFEMELKAYPTSQEYIDFLKETYSKK